MSKRNLGKQAAAALLVMLNSGETIPVELYRIIAAIYAEVVYSANDMKKGK